MPLLKMSLYFDFDGVAITREEWSALFENRKNDDSHRIGFTKLNHGEYEISTVWLGLDHSSGMGGPPLIFETMVFGHGDEPLYEWEQRRYSTKEQARAGHEETVAAVMDFLREKNLKDAKKKKGKG